MSRTVWMASIPEKGSRPYWTDHGRTQRLSDEEIARFLGQKYLDVVLGGYVLSGDEKVAYIKRALGSLDNAI